MSLRDKGDFFLDIISQMYNIGIGGFFILVLPLSTPSSSPSPLTPPLPTGERERKGWGEKGDGKGGVEVRRSDGADGAAAADPQVYC